MEEIVRLTGADYEQAIDFLDQVFSQANGPHHFEWKLPRMCKPDDEHMGKHFAVRVNGRIVSMLGVYPLPMVIAGEKFLFSTTGNVATHYRYEGRGYAHRLLNRAMEELERIGADASRLGGFRQRYNRFGFEMAGSAYRFHIADTNVREIHAEPVRFEPVDIRDETTILALQAMQTETPFYAERGNPEEFYLVQAAWEHKPYAAYDAEGRLMGSLCISPDRSSCAEVIARDGKTAEAMVVQWLKSGWTTTLNVTLPPWNTDAIRRLSSFCNMLSVDSPSRYKIINWSGISNALCRIQSGLAALPDGEFTLGITGGPVLHFAAEGGTARCEETDGAADLVLDRLAATRLLFGPQAPWTVAKELGVLASALLPLPLTWCGQDRV